MTTQNVKNNHESPLSVGNVVIPSGATVAVPNWDRVSKGSAVKTFLEAGVIETDGKSVTQMLPNGTEGESGNAADAAEDAEKDRIIGELREKHGIEKTKRTSLENLRKELEGANAAKGGTPSTTPATGGLPGAPAPAAGLPGAPPAGGTK